MNSVTSEWVKVPGIVVDGYGVASGRDHVRFPGGTIRAQLPHFRARGVHLYGVFPGTLNISIAPLSLSVVEPRHTLEQVSWWPGIPAETFSFSPCRLLAAETIHDGTIYYPHPETKPDHHHPPTVVEVLAPFIEGLVSGSPVELWLNPEEIRVLAD